MANQNAGDAFRSIMADEFGHDNPGALRGDNKKKGEGSWVFTGQVRAVEDGFRNVSKIWFDKTITYGDGLQQIEEGKALTEDILCPVSAMQPSVDKGQFVFQHVDGRTFRPTEHAMNQAGNWADCGTWYVNSLLHNPTDAKDRQLYARDEGDAATLMTVLRNGFRRIDKDKKFLFRTRKDGTLRAMLTERYARVDNRWFIEKLAEFIPGGRLSHWRGDSDTVYGNVLIPDTIRKETDSDYGGMLSIGNSEIGERRVSSLPSIFRAICMNGCIWGATKGEGIKQVHRGKICLEKLAMEIRVNLEKQIPLLPQGIDKLLGTRSFGIDGVSALAVLASVVGDYSFSKVQATKLLEAYHTERSETPDYAKTLFGVINAVTRAGQRGENAEWLKFDTLGGDLSKFERKDFDRMLVTAKNLSTDEIEAAFGMAA